MGRRVKWTKAAIADLMEIADYIARDSRYYAEVFVSGIRDKSSSLSKLTYRSRKVPEFGRDDVRELIVSNYRMIFQVKRDMVKILAIIHTARELKGVEGMEDEEDELSGAATRQL